MGDFGDSLSTKISVTYNNYAANTLTVNNEFSVL